MQRPSPEQRSPAMKRPRVSIADDLDDVMDIAETDDLDESDRPDASFIKEMIGCMNKQVQATFYTAQGSLRTIAESVQRRRSSLDKRPFTSDDLHDLYCDLYGIISSFHESGQVLESDAKTLKDAVDSMAKPRDNQELDRKMDLLLEAQVKNTYAARVRMPPPAFAQQTKRPNKPKQTRHFSVVTSKSDTHSNESIRSTTQQALQPAVADLNILSVKLASNKSVLFESESAEDRMKLMKMFETDAKLADFKIETARQPNPTIVLRGVTEEANRNAEEFGKLILGCNTEIRDIPGVAATDFQILFQQKPRSRKDKLQDVILRVPPKVREVLLLNRKVKLGYGIVHVEDYTNVTICYKCLRFGHHAKLCTNEQECSHCGQKHKYADCPAKNDKTKASCLNCARENDRLSTKNPKAKKHDVSHPTISRSCPQMKAMANIVASRINYG